MINNRTEFLNKIYWEIPVDTTWMIGKNELLKAVMEYKRKHQVFLGNIKDIKVTNGVLYLDGEMIIRVCDKPVKTYNEESYYWEGKILKRDEIY